MTFAQVIISDQVADPYLNLAVEQWLVESGKYPTLYLWRNRRTVVIGQNQNPYSEVNLEALIADDGHLMRRCTGGGAVYHDEGNLNFSFIMPHALYNQQRQFAVIQHAVESFGLQTKLSGRNDILVDCGDGDDSFKKFSGNAFSKGRQNNLHHGTLLVVGDMEALGRYLRPNNAKLQRHGVQSVRSRVANLHNLCVDISVDLLAQRLQDAFVEEYGNVEISHWPLVRTKSEVLTLRDRLASDRWLYGRWSTFTASQSNHFIWGSVEMQLTIVDGVITDVQIASDALDTDIPDRARRLLTGAPVDKLPQVEEDGFLRDILGMVKSE
mgnify:CR=1 FL=1